MDFKLVKNDLRKPILWFGSITLSLMVISSILIMSINLELKEKISVFCQVNLNFILVYLAATLINLSRFSTHVFYNVAVITEIETNEKQTEVVRGNFIYVFITIFTIGAFFIELSSGALINKVSWGENASKIWWVFFIIMFLNAIYLFLFFEVTIYLMNQNEKFKKTYLEFINNSEKKEVSAES